MINIKTLYVFSLPYETEVDEPFTSKDEQGNEISGNRKVKKSIDRKVALRKPTRSLLDDAELYFNVLVSEGIKSGLMSRALLAKRFNNDGGVLSQPEKVAYGKAYNDLEEKEREYNKLVSMASSSSDEEKASASKLKEEIAGLRRGLQELEMSQLQLFDITAESRARTKTILWWVLHLVHKEELGKPDQFVPIFKGETLEELFESYDAIEEGDNIPQNEKDFLFKAIRRAAEATAYWFYGTAVTQEDFATLEAQIKAREINVPAIQESVKAPETA